MSAAEREHIDIVATHQTSTAHLQLLDSLNANTGIWSCQALHTSCTHPLRILCRLRACMCVMCSWCIWQSAAARLARGTRDWNS